VDFLQPLDIFRGMVELFLSLLKGVAPLGGSFKLCLDAAAVNNGVISMQQDLCTDFIAHNVGASAAESGGDGASMEEKLEVLVNIGDVSVSHSQFCSLNVKW
jgi:hypothetical protein